MAARSHYASDAAYERSQQASREAKRRRTGRCRCGAITRYSGHAVNGGVSSRCPKCAAQDSVVLRRGKGPTEARVLAVVGDRVVGYSEIRDALGISNGHASNLLHRLVKYGHLRRVGRGRYARGDAA